MYFTIYKTTNMVNGMIYIGQHITNNLNDNYLGSGIEIKQQLMQYGKQNFTKETMFIFDNFDEMNNKEKELITEEFLSQPHVMNRQLGGSGKWMTKRSVVVFMNNKWCRISVDKYDSNIHITPCSGTVRVFDLTLQSYRRVPCDVYHTNKSNFLTASSGKVTIRHIGNNKTESINIKDFNKLYHKKVFGGIVVKINDTNMYVDKETFIKSKMKGIHVGKVTVLDTTDGIRKHISKKDYDENPKRYIHASKGRITCRNIETNETSSITKEQYEKNKHKYIPTTKGEKTVWLIQEQRFINIKKETFNRDIHRLALDKMIKCFDEHGNILIDFWGTKIDFVKKYGILIYLEALKETKNFQPKQPHKFKKFQNCSFQLIDWRKHYEQHKK